jgi:zinc/manganese transport system substrate-binding protein
MSSLRKSFLVASATALLVAVTACSSGSSPASEGDTAATLDTATSVDTATSGNIVVTYSAIGDVVSRLVGDAATVTVLIPNGQDQHDFMPSAKDVETVNNASLVVSNGLDLEEGLEDAMVQAEKSGVAMFHIADHVTLLESTKPDEKEGAVKEEGHEDEEDHGHGTEDPHVWLDPETLAEAIPALAEALKLATGKDFTEEATAVVGELTALSASVRDIMTTVDECKLVTGHDSLGYFAARYGCTVVGAVIPGFSTAAEASAGSLAGLKVVAKENGVKAIFTELGTPADVAAQIAKEVGVDVVQLSTHVLPENGGYNEMMTQLATAIADGLS